MCFIYLNNTTSENIIVVPVTLTSNDSKESDVNISSSDAIEKTMTNKGFGKKENSMDIMTAPYIAKPAQVRQQK